MKVYVHVWSDAIRHNLAEPAENPSYVACILIRSAEDMSRVYVVEEVQFNAGAHLVFKPLPEERLSGFGGRVMNWIEAADTQTRVKLGDQWYWFNDFVRNVDFSKNVKVLTA